MVGDVSLKFLALLYSRLAGGLDGGHDLLPKPGQPLLVAQQGEPIAVSVIFTPELTK